MAVGNTPPSPHHVLIVEDDPAVRWTLAIALQKRGLECDVAESGREAMELLKRNGARYCTVILDLNVPSPDGFDIARYIQQNHADVPVIVASGYPDLRERIAAAEIGPVVKLIMAKPIDVATVAEIAHGECARGR